MLESGTGRLLHVDPAAGRVEPVAEVPGFARSGGIINFTIKEDKVRFEINPAAAQRANLTISSQLLRLATIVRT